MSVATLAAGASGVPIHTHMMGAHSAHTMGVISRRPKRAAIAGASSTDIAR